MKDKNYITEEYFNTQVDVILSRPISEYKAVEKDNKGDPVPYHRFIFNENIHTIVLKYYVLYLGTDQLRNVFNRIYELYKHYREKFTYAKQFIFHYYDISDFMLVDMDILAHKSKKREIFNSIYELENFELRFLYFDKDMINAHIKIFEDGIYK